jgi:long-chain acyl-CoA synthetase
MSIELNDVIASLGRFPKARVACIDAGGRHELEFAELRRRVSAAVGILQIRGVAPGAHVGLLAANSLEWLVVDLACLAIGAVSVPFDRGYAWGDAAQLVADWDLTVLVTDLRPAADNIIDIAEFHRSSDDALGPYRYEPDDCSTAKFSSGSTARPKAVKASAAHFDHTARHIATMFPVGQGDLFLMMASLSTWLQRFMIHLSILQGCNVAICRPEMAIQALETERPALVIGVPRLLETVYLVHQRRMKSDPAASLFATWGGRLRYLWTGSAPISRTVLDAYITAGVPVFEGYGMTEIGMIAKNFPENRRVGSVGRVFPEKQVAFDTSGEILVRSEFHANDHYWRGEGKAFRGDGWVATGDIGHIDEEGYVYIDGRITDAVVLSTGYKIFPPAVEEQLRRHPTIADCAVLSHDGVHLVAAVQPSDPAISDADIERALSSICDSWPAHQRILDFVRVEAFTPESGLRTPNGKLNRKAVAERYASLHATPLHVQTEQGTHGV